MMIRKTGYYTLLLLCFSVKVLAIEALYSHAVFHMPADKNKLKPYIEAYWQIDPKHINFVKGEDSLWTAKVITVFTVFNEQGATVAEDKYIMQTNPATFEGIYNQTIIELHRYEVPAGKYYVSLKLTDATKNGNTYSHSDSIIIESTKKPFYSSLQVLDTVFDSKQQSVFLRNDRQQIPLCFNFLDERKTVRYYTELYQLENASQRDTPFIQHAFISKKKDGKVVLNLEQRDTIRPERIIPVLGSFQLEYLPSGNYYINVDLENSQYVKLASKTAFFQLINTAPVSTATDDTGTKEVFEKVEVIDIGNTFVGKYNISQLMAILKMISPIATPIETDAINTFLKRPEETYIRYFIFNFWSTRNEKNPKESWDEYTKRIRQVNKLFGSGGLTGYETDRGIVWLKFGKPEERLTVQNEQGVLPYEIWRYDAPGRQSFPGVFLFYRPGFMVGDYRLLHSTVNGEMRNLNWRTILYVSGSSSGNVNSRAEQYLGNK